jgi:pyruvate-formate lyase
MLLFCLFTLCSACVSPLVIGKWQTSNFEREQMVSACLAETAVTKTATLLGASRARVPKAMSAYTNHGKATSAKRNTDRKRSSYIEEDSFEKS